MPSRISSPVFVGRAQELDRVLAAVGTTQAATVLIGGEAGVGKTRFVQEAARAARGTGAIVLEGGCVPIGSESLPFGPFIEAFRQLRTHVTDEQLETLLVGAEGALAPLITGGVGGTEQVPPLSDANGAGQGRFFEQLLLFLERLARAETVLVILEDIHWADRSTLELLTFLTRNLRLGPVTIVATFRTDELDRQHPLVPFLAEQLRSRKVEHIDLASFELHELAVQTRAILGHQPEDSLVDLIYARSGGNAFHVEELLATQAPAGPLPETLRAVLLARLQFLSEPTEVFVRVASAGGPRVQPSLVASVAGMNEQATENALREAIGRHVLVERRSSESESYAFRHALLQEAMYGELLATERVRFHAAFAEAIEAVAATENGREDSRAGEIAYHREAANDLPGAFDAHIRAGIAAEGVYAHADAAVHFQAALGLWDRVADAEVRSPFDRPELMTRAAVNVQATDLRRAIGLSREAIGLVDANHQPARAGLLHDRLADQLVNIRDAGALRESIEAVRLVPPVPPAIARARVLAGLAHCLWNFHRHPEGIESAAEAVAIAESLGAGTEEARGLIWLGANEVGLGLVGVGIDHLRRAASIGRESGDVFIATRARVWLSNQLFLTNAFDEAIATGLQAYELASATGLVTRFGSTAFALVARAQITAGDWQSARVTLVRGEQCHGQPDPAVGRQLQLLEALQGDFVAARDRDERVVWDPEGGFIKHMLPPQGLVELALWGDNPDGARTLSERAVAVLEYDPWPSVQEAAEVYMAGLRAEADLALRARSRRQELELTTALMRGQALLERMRALEEEVRDRRPIFAPTAAAALAACEGEWNRLAGAEDPAVWATAAAGWDHLGRPYPAGYALMREGEAALRRDLSGGRAERALEAADKIATRLGARPLHGMIRGLMEIDHRSDRVVSTCHGQGDGRSRSGVPRRSVTKRGLLSPREREILVLVVAGRSNGEIGEALFMSKKTASVHVANIKAKLGASTRIEIVALAIALGLIEAGHLFESAGPLS